MTVTYQPILVLLSVGVAIIGSLTALALTALSNIEDTTPGQKTFALVSGGLIMGATIWSMHFVAMMAVDFPVLVTYNAAETFSSIGIAIGATGTGLFFASSRPLGWPSIPLGGVLMGLGIAGMHYLGMSAIRGCGLDYDYNLVATSIGMAIVASMAALWFAFHKRSVAMTVAGGIVQGLAIASMHYTGMAATYFLPMGAEIEIIPPILSQSNMAYMIACGIVLMSVVNLAFVALMTREPA
ncbi:MAG TPA: MHYT domain-containing protein [Hyphomicrobiaceae bacterium]|nr:MHYT domain-containing protein [Hyphomicrobiaceae bacterium]